MKYAVNTEKLGNAFLLPAEAADKWLKLATNTQLKVLLCAFRSLAEGIDAEAISNRLGITKPETEDALSFWVEAGLLTSERESAQNEKPKIITKNIDMPTRQDVIKRGMEDENLRFLFRQAQSFFGRNLKQNESSYIVYLYDDCGMEPAVILYLISYAASCGKCNLSFIKTHSTKWLNAGVDSVKSAEEIVAKEAREDLAWKTVQSVFGIEKRNPSEKEKSLSDMWLNQWQISTNLLKAAYDTCVDTKSKFSVAYISAILESWHKKGIKTPEDVLQDTKKRKTAKKDNNSYAGFDLEAFEKSLEED